MRTIVHLSDIHFGTVDDAVCEGVVADVREQQPNLVVMSGDFTQRARAGQYRAAMDFMRRLPQPQLVVPGNHDIPLFDVFTRFFRPMRNYTAHVTKDLYYNSSGTNNRTGLRTMRLDNVLDCDPPIHVTPPLIEMATQ